MTGVSKCFDRTYSSDLSMLYFASSLQNDPVSNIRCLLAKSLSEAPTWLLDHQEVLLAAKNLCVDIDIDVRWYIGNHSNTPFHNIYVELENDGSVADAESRRLQRKLSVLAEDNDARARLESAEIEPVVDPIASGVIPLHTSFSRLSVAPGGIVADIDIG